jgi:hypothetical protein
MTKRILKLFLLLALAASLYAMTAKADGGAVDPKPARTAEPSSVPTVTPRACEVVTGFDAGTVNLRACGSTSCAVMDILTEGESLNIVTAGLWVNVTTEDGVTGWLNSNYCKGE